MAAIIPGFEYDIFISYRHNDNRSGWVTEFVKALQEELAAAIKDSVSVYFDTNPHDGLLETHNVGKSLEGKLKCLIFIPIISQTYCDTKSFAWQHEFVTFNNLSKEDPFGRDIKLHNGNVASRILPIKIHDLDIEDQALLENELGGVLRAIEFIYKEAGVNRPLKSTDNKNDNQNKTDYRNQVNKAANAIKEIVSALKNPSTTSTQTTNYRSPLTSYQPISYQKKIVIALMFSLFIAATGYFFYPKIFASTEVANLDKSIAVLPFENVSSDQEEYLSEGITDQLITSLGHVKGLKVASRTSVMTYKGSPLKIEEIARELKVAYLVEGSVMKADNRLRISVRLIEASNNSQKWNETYSRDFKDILDIQDEISQRVSESLGHLLDLSALKQEKPSNTEAYDHFLRGEFLWRRVESKNIRHAIHEFKQSARLDPQFALAYSRIGFGYLLLASPWGDSNLKNVVDSANYYNELGLKINPELPEGLDTKGTITWWADKDYDESEILFREALKRNRNSISLLNLGFFLNSQGKPQEGLQYCLEGFKLDPAYLPSSAFLGDSYFFLKDFDQAEFQYKQALKLYPTNTDPIYRLAWLYCNTNRFDEAKKFLTEKIKYFGERDPRPQIYLAIAYAKLGNVQQSKSILDSLMFSSKKGVSVFDLNIYLAAYYSATAQKDKMYAALEVSLEENEIELIWLKVDPVFEPFRNEPKFKTILEKVGFK